LCVIKSKLGRLVRHARQIEICEVDPEWRAVVGVERWHRSREFIAVLKDLDQYYLPGRILRIILDNHSAHISKETQTLLLSNSPQNGACVAARGQAVALGN
jgi:hypothetical protein